MDSKCFRKETLLSANDSLFENVIDACYLLTMEGSKRRDSYMKQLNKYKPFHCVHVIHNKGFKNCQKDPLIDNSLKDIADAFAQIFTECLANDHKRVLVFEDDFFFTESYEIIQDYVLHIQVFLDSVEEFMTYNLGPLPYFMMPSTIDMNHYIYKGGASHAMIYSQEAMKLYCADYKTMDCSSDIYWNQYMCNYCFHKPFCFQLCPQTENSEYWCDWVDINGLLRDVFQADKTHKHLFLFTHTISKILPIMCILFIIKKLKK